MKGLIAVVTMVTVAALMLCSPLIAADSNCGGDRCSQKCNDFNFDGTKSSATGGCKLEYLWDFGDGTTSDCAKVTHHYEKAGTYTVKLTVKDGSGMACDTSVTTQTVTAYEAPVAVFNGPDCICAGNSVTFDASASTSTSGNLNYKWDFGDGTTGEGVKVNKVYDQGGNYKVRLLIDDGRNSECSCGCAELCVRVNCPPKACAGNDITMTCLRQGTPLTVCFNGSGSDPDGNDCGYTWNFGDGATGTGAKVSHTYEKAGTYKATLTVNDGSETPCCVDSQSINVVLSMAPQAIAGENMEACVGNTLTFDGSKSVIDGAGSISYTWDFGDGETATGVKATHAYKQGGKYTATLTVDNGECKSCDSLNVCVNASPTAMLEKCGSFCVGDCVTFDASGSCDPDGDSLKYTWDFGDGELVEGGAMMSRQYEKGGNYTVKVTVDDCRGTPCSISQASTPISVNARPMAIIAPTDACCVGVTTTFDGSQSSDPDGNQLTYAWDFGDGATATGAKVTHVYSQQGCYKVVLTVDDGLGSPCSTSCTSTTANIHQGPAAEISVC